MAATEADLAAKVIERLLVDPAFRAEFRKDPAAACRKAGLDDLADEMSIGAGKAMMTLDQRESKSSLAGVMMAAAMEGVGIYQFGEHILPHLDDVPSAVGDVLSRVSLPAIDLKGALAGGPDAPVAAPPADAPAENGAEEAGAAAAGGNGGGAAEAPPEGAPPEDAAAAGEKADKAAEAKEAVVPPEQKAASKAADKISAAESPEAKRADEVQEAVEKIKEESKDLPDASDVPNGPVAPQLVEEVGKGAGKPAEAPPPSAPAPPAQAAPAAPPDAAAPAAAAEAAAGTGGGGSAAEALLQNKNLVLDADAQKDIRDGAVDPRMIALLGKLTEKHKIELSVIKTGHDQFTSGGSVSNHFVGRGIDIARVDGEIVNPGSPAARELATAIAEMTGDLRPTEVGTPWAIGASGFFTDGAHQDHLHVAYDGEPPEGFKAPAPSAAPAAGAPVAAAAAVPGQPAAAAAAVAEPKAKPGDSLSFKAVTAKEAAEAAKPKKGDSLGFMQAVQPQQPAAPVASVAAADPTAAAGAGVPADLSSVPDAYPGDDASKPEIAAWMAKQAQARGLPPELPLMASLVESGMTNIQGGDADSVGFFQMRVGIWNQGEYAGYPKKPELQVKWFLDQAEAVKKQRIAAGEPIDDPNSFGEWIADVERPAEQYRGRYQLKLEEAQGLLDNAPKGNGAGAVAPAPPAAVEPSGQAAAPAEQAQGGGAQKVSAGGGTDALGGALLENKSLVLDADAQKDVREGAVDPRMLAVLDKLTEKHKIELSVIKTGHDQFTSGGSVSNHFVGRGIDIAKVDGEIVNPGSAAARELATEIAELTGDLRPTEVGTPWAIAASGFFTDGAHQDHLHVAFDGEPPADFKPPAPGGGAAAAVPPAAPGAPVAAAAATPGQPAAAAGVAQPKAKPGDSLSFRAVTAEEAAEKATPKKGDSLSFRAVQPPMAPASGVAEPGTAPAAVAEAVAAAAAPGASNLGAAALDVANGELAKGVKEVGTNTGPEVDEYLAAAGVAPGNPWCASFVTWALKQKGHTMEGGGWAAVQSWVRAAEAGTDNLQIVSAEDARPGDLVTYDWGGQEDFGADGHMGFLASNVQGGKFTAVEGNYQDAVTKSERQLGDANIKFIRINGGAPPAAEVPTPSAPSPPVDPGQAGPGAVEVAAADATGANPYPGDDAGKEQIAAWMAKEAEKRGLPKQLPLMASLVESGMTNIQGGDADSVGFFQMRVGIWNQGEYAGYPKKPELQVKWFLDQAEAVKKQRIAAGKPVDDPNSFGEWIADVERPAEQYRGRYQLKLDEANGLLGTADSAPPAATPAVEQASAAKASAATAADASGDRKKQGTLEFMAVKAEDAARKHRATVQFMKAIDPKQASAAAAPGAAPVAQPAAAAASAAPATGPTAAEDAAANQAVGAPVPEGELALQNVGPIGTYPGDSASQEQLAQWLASEAKKAGLPPELPVMASLVESGVKNLKGGDADSAGFFQMRVGIWDNGPYKGFRMNPQLQAKWFIDNALQVKKARLAAGKSVTDPGSFGEWIADVERPAAQYRYKYQLRLTEARKLLGGR